MAETACGLGVQHDQRGPEGHRPVHSTTASMAKDSRTKTNPIPSKTKFTTPRVDGDFGRARLPPSCRLTAPTGEERCGRRAVIGPSVMSGTRIPTVVLMKTKLTLGPLTHGHGLIK